MEVAVIFFMIEFGHLLLGRLHSFRERCGAKLVAGDHRPEVAEAGANHLDDVDEEEGTQTNGHEQVNAACCLIAPEQVGKPSKLRWLEDGKAGGDDDECHDQHRGVGNLLDHVVLAVRWSFFAHANIVEHGAHDVLEIARLWDDVTTLAAEYQVPDVEQAVDNEQPAEAEVERKSTSELPVELECFIEVVGDEVVVPELSNDAGEVEGPVDP